jgi:hypothetical protein
MFKRTKTCRRVALRLFKRINFKPGPAEFGLAMARLFSVNLLPPESRPFSISMQTENIFGTA